VERRKEPRIEITGRVTVTVLAETEAQPDSKPFEAIAVDISDGGMRLLSPFPVKYQAVVKVQTRDLLLLGEVIRSEVCEQGTILAVKLEHSLDSLADLRRLNESLRWEDRPAPITVRD
jgi:c-di-GMP-binding flagellar brake protein YcgR